MGTVRWSCRVRLPCLGMVWVGLAVALGLGGGGALAQSAEEAYAAQAFPAMPRQVVDDACREGSLMIYSLVFPGNLQDLLKTFAGHFPCVATHIFTASGGALAERFTSESEAGASAADVWMNTSPAAADTMVDGGFLMQWTPSTADLVPDDWKHEGYWYAIGLAPIGLIWNTQETTPAQEAWLENVKRWDQIGEAPIAGQTALVDIRAGGTTQLAYYFFRQAYGLDFLKKLAALRPTIFDGVNPLLDRMVAGEFPAAPVATTDPAGGKLFAIGAPLRWAFPEPGLAVPDVIGLSAKAPHPNAAKVFMTWSLSAEGQTAWVNSTNLAPTSKLAIDRRPFAAQSWYHLPASYYKADWRAIEQAMPELTAQFSTIFGASH